MADYIELDLVIQDGDEPEVYIDLSEFGMVVNDPNGSAAIPMRVFG